MGPGPGEKTETDVFKAKDMGIDPFYRWKLSANGDYEAQEATIYRFLGPIFPFECPKYYFADICRENTNYCLITEKIPYPKGGNGTVYKPYDVLPVAEKYFDFQLEPRMRYEMYYCIMKAQARMAAWGKLGFFDVAPPEMRGMTMAQPTIGQFPWPVKLTEKKRAVKAKAGETAAKLWQELLCDKAKGLYPAEHTSHSFVTAVANCCREAVAYKDEIYLYGGLFPDMVGFQHSNLQSDNAYYWRNDQDEMDCGLIDWGGASPGNYCNRMGGSVTSAEGEILDEHEEGLLKCFIEEYYKECGIKIDFDEMQRQWWLNYCFYLAQLGTSIELEIFRETPRDEWKHIDSVWHSKVVGRWNVRCYVFMIGTALKYLHLRWVKNGKGRLHCHETLVEWRDYWISKGMV
jgi:hypothetical protein